MNMNKEFNW